MEVYWGPDLRHAEADPCVFFTFLWFDLFMPFCFFVFLADPRKKYHVKLLAYNIVGDGYQADQTISTPGCVCESHSVVENMLILCAS